MNNLTKRLLGLPPLRCAEWAWERTVYRVEGGFRTSQNRLQYRHHTHNY